MFHVWNSFSSTSSCGRQQASHVDYRIYILGAVVGSGGEPDILDTEEFEAGGDVYGSICHRLEEDLHEMHAYSHIGCEV